MGKLWLGLASEEDTQMEGYNKFKAFWLKVWRVITLQYLWNKNLKKKKEPTEKSV